MSSMAPEDGGMLKGTDKTGAAAVRARCIRRSTAGGDLMVASRQMRVWGAPDARLCAAKRGMGLLEVCRRSSSTTEQGYSSG